MSKLCDKMNHCIILLCTFGVAALSFPMTSINNSLTLNPYKENDCRVICKKSCEDPQDPYCDANTGYCTLKPPQPPLPEDSDFVHQYVILPVFVRLWRVMITNDNAENAWVRIRCRGPDTTDASFIATRPYCSKYKTDIEVYGRHDSRYINVRPIYAFDGIEGYKNTETIKHVMSIEATKPITPMIQSVLDLEHRDCAALYTLWQPGDLVSDYVIPILSRFSFFLVMTLDEEALVTMYFRSQHGGLVVNGTRRDENFFRFNYQLDKYSARMVVLRDWMYSDINFTSVILNASSPVSVLTGISDRSREEQGERPCSHGHTIFNLRHVRTSDRYFLIPPIKAYDSQSPIVNKILVIAVQYYTEVQIGQDAVTIIREIGDTYVYTVTDTANIIRVIGRKGFLVLHYLERTKRDSVDVALSQQSSVARMSQTTLNVILFGQFITDKLRVQVVQISLHDSIEKMDDLCVVDKKTFYAKYIEVKKYMTPGSRVTTFNTTANSAHNGMYSSSEPATGISRPKQLSGWSKEVFSDIMVLNVDTALSKANYLQYMSFADKAEPYGEKCYFAPEHAVPDDGFDNDCDGRIDEDALDGKDNDDDGYVDEDPGTGVEFEVCEEWSEWACRPRCGARGPVHRTRQCSKQSSLLLGDNHGAWQQKAGFEGVCESPSCPKGCPKGFWKSETTGECTRKCPVNCFQRKCDYTTGVCKGCNRGFKGPRCDKTCDSDSFGRDCAKKCDMFCEGGCDPTYGFCTDTDYCLIWMILNGFVWVFCAFPAWVLFFHAWLFYGKNEERMWPWGGNKEEFNDDSDDDVKSETTYKGSTGKKSDNSGKTKESKAKETIKPYKQEGMNETLRKRGNE